MSFNCQDLRVLAILKKDNPMTHWVTSRLGSIEKNINSWKTLIICATNLGKITLPTSRYPIFIVVNLYSWQIDLYYAIWG